MDQCYKDIFKKHLPEFVRTVDSIALLPHLPCLTENIKVSIYWPF